MPTVKKIGLIEEDTVLLPHIIAQSVAGEVEWYLRREINADELESYLTGRAQKVYEANDMFRKRIRSNRGNSARDHLYTFMRHWTAGWVDDHNLGKMPESFAAGRRLPEDARVPESSE